MMTDAELDAIRARADAATPGPWRYDRDTDGYRDAGFFVEPAGDIDFDWDDYIVAAGDTRTIVEEEGIDWEARGLPGNPGFGVMKLNDADFIAHARADIPALLEEVERLRGALKMVEWAEMEGRCPWCWAYYGEPHAVDCERQIALGLQEDA